jgi:hypothetical protein
MTRAAIVICAMLPCIGVAAESDDPLTALLEEPVLAPGQPLAEVKHYAVSLVPGVPRMKSVSQWESYAQQLRSRILNEIVFRGEAATWRDAETRVQWLETLEGGPGYRIKKLRYEALPGLWIPALLYEPEHLDDKAPVFLNVNGHDPVGKATDYKQLRCINQAKRGILALNVEWLGMGQLKEPNYLHYRMNQMDLCGTSGLAPFYLAMSRALDLLLALPGADARCVGVAGLSGGGWQTIIISSLDTRVTLMNPVAGYGSLVSNIRFGSLGDSEQAPSDLATLADYAHLKALLAPRMALLTYNADDQCCFRAEHALRPLLAAASPVYRLYGQQDRLHSHVNQDPGTHNFEQDNRQQLYGLIAKGFFNSSAGVPREEIDSLAEIQSAEALHVPMPEENADFHSLAMCLGESLPRDAGLPEVDGDDPSQQRQDAETWQTPRREALASLVRLVRLPAIAEQIREKETDGLRATHWKLDFEQRWTVPVVELTSKGADSRDCRAKGSVLIVGDQGRAALSDKIRGLLEKGHRVFAVDPFYLGESRIQGGDPEFLYPILLGCLGQRALGIQASQLAECAHWIAEQREGGPVTLLAVGPRSGVAALVAAATTPQSIAGVELREGLGSLKQVIEENHAVTEMPELFCFGLLERFDLFQMAALVAPRPVTWHVPSDRAKKELRPLKAWYATWGITHDPLQP